VTNAKAVADEQSANDASKTDIGFLISRTPYSVSSSPPLLARKVKPRHQIGGSRMQQDAKLKIDNLYPQIRIKTATWLSFFVRNSASQK
jgi:hypothetical protein